MNIMSSWYLESANHCSGPFKYGEDEMGFSGLTKVPSDVVCAPRVGESAVQFECQVSTHFSAVLHTVTVRYYFIYFCLIESELAKTF